LPGKDKWDPDAVCKPYAIFDGRRWLLWDNGRKGGVEQIRLALHQGLDLGFQGERRDRCRPLDEASFDHLRR
jgi:hypothetical protein